MSASLAPKTVVRIDGMDYSYFGTFWGRLHFLSVRTGRRMRIHTPFGESIEPDSWDFSDLVNTGRAVVVSNPARQWPRDGSKRRPWLASDRNRRQRPSEPDSVDAAQ